MKRIMPFWLLGLLTACPALPAVDDLPPQQELQIDQGIRKEMSGIVHHTKGRVIRTEQEYLVAHPFENVLWALDTFKESTLIAEPGSKYSYTTHGYILLIAVVERVGKKKFSHQIRNRIALPLDLTTLQPDYQWEARPRRAVGYRKRDGKVMVSADTDVSGKLGGGGYRSSIGNLARYATGLSNGRLLQPKTRELVWIPKTTRSGKPMRYELGFGFCNYQDGKLLNHSPQDEGARLVGHSGSQEKTRTRMTLWPRRKLGDGSHDQFQACQPAPACRDHPRRPHHNGQRQQLRYQQPVVTEKLHPKMRITICFHGPIDT